MTTQNNAIGDELKDLEQYIKAGYLVALRANGSSFTDATATAFSDYVITRVTGLLSMVEKSRDKRIALAAEIKQTRRIRRHHNSARGMSYYDDFFKAELEMVNAKLAELKQAQNKEK